ncbi:hypothetical protein [Kitasatospora viridis]|uniref:hypothetical protein n=1 Tax=Kitasatospora viridis TaxID=281105 RepID=UPI0011A44044|nr:hypothetical protein [Kitasatospora viridis]
MTGLPGFLMVHQVTIEAYQGDSAYGPRWAPPTAVRCFLDEGTRMVRARDGREVSSTSTAYCPLTTTAPTDSRVTLPDGRQATVIQALRRDGGTLPVPSHLEVQLT